MESINPSQTDFLVLPISGEKDLFVVYRHDGSSYKRLVLNYKDLITSINSLIVSGSGTVTSVTIAASNALSATGSPITTSGTITLSWTGDNLQYVLGDGTLAARITALSQLTNDVGFITSAALAPYLTIASAAATYVPLARTINIQGVTQDLSADRIYTFPSLPLRGGMYIEQTFLSNVGPISVLWIPSVDKVYCANHANNTITIYNATTAELTNTLTLAGATHLVHVQGITTPEIWAFGSTAPTVISRINITAAVAGETIFATYTGFGSMVTANNPNDVLEISSTKAYISQFASNSIAVVNPSTGVLTTTIILVGSNPVGLCINNNGASLMNGRVVVAQVNGLTIIDEATNTITALSVNPSSLLNSCNYIKYVPSRDIYIVASAGNQRVVVLQPASATTFTVLATIRGLNAPVDIFVDESNETFFVSHISGQGQNNVLNLNVTSVDLNTYRVLQTIYGNVTGGTATYKSKFSGDLTSRRIFTTLINSPINGTFIKLKY